MERNYILYVNENLWDNIFEKKKNLFKEKLCLLDPANEASELNLTNLYGYSLHI